jgi:putative ABC transport system permease protein
VPRFRKALCSSSFWMNILTGNIKAINYSLTILWWFTVLAIIVASLGLLGLSLYTVAKRTKEIGIRKVLGANIIQITTLITKDYIKLILYAGLIAVPAAYFILQNWLKDYAFHVEIGVWFFVLPW